jgi:hypothetical protein
MDKVRAKSKIEKKEEILRIETIHGGMIMFREVCELDVKNNKARGLNIKYRNFPITTNAHKTRFPDASAERMRMRKLSCVVNASTPMESRPAATSSECTEERPHRPGELYIAYVTKLGSIT